MSGVSHAFGFVDIHDLLWRGEQEVKRVFEAQQSYAQVLGAALKTISDHKELSADKLATTSGYDEDDIRKAFKGTLSLKRFGTLQEIATALGCKSTDHVIATASLLGPSPRRVLTLEQKKQWGSDLRLIIQFNEAAIKVLAHTLGMPMRTMEAALYPPFLAAEPVYKKISGHFKLTREQAHEFAQDLRFKLIHFESFGEILKAYRKKLLCTQATLGFKLLNTSNRETAGGYVNDIESGSNVLGYKAALLSLKKLGFESMHELIAAAGLSEKYPDPTAMALVKTDLSAKIDALFETTTTEADLNLSMRELARRKNSKNEPPVR